MRQALAYASSRGERAAVAVDDTATGAYTAAGDADGQYSSASVIKVLVATDLLLTGQMSGDTASTAYQMIAASDDDDADALYGLVGGDSVITTIAAHYGIPNLGSPPGRHRPVGGNQDHRRRARAPLRHAEGRPPGVAVALGCDEQHHPARHRRHRPVLRHPLGRRGLGRETGWMTGLGPGSTYDSTGYVDGNRYAVVILTYGSVAQYGQYMSNTITQMAKDTMPSGVIGAPTADCPA